MVHRLLPWFRLSLRRFDRGIRQDVHPATGWYSLAQISEAVIGLSDVLIVGAAAGVQAAAIYAVGQRLALLPQRIVQPAGVLLFTKAGQLAARDNRAGLRDDTDEVVRFVQVLSVPAAIVLGFLAGPAIEVWVGPLYQEAAAVIGLLCLAAVVQAWAQAISLAISGAGRPTLAIDPLRRRGRAPCGPRHRPRSALRRHWAWPRRSLISVVVMEGTLMLPLVYRQLGDSVLRRAARTRSGSWACPSSSPAASPGLSGGAAARCTPSPTRISGSSDSSVSWPRAPRSMVVFYALLLGVRCPAGQRQQLLARFRGR